MDVECSGCGGLFPDVNGPTHPYMSASSGCWAAYQQVLAREHRHAERSADAHRLIVDAYAVQHQWGESASNLRSVGFHLCRLCLILERGIDPSGANASMTAMAALKSRFTDLARPRSLGDVTVADVRKASGLEDEIRIVQLWSASVWQAWSPYHATVREWLDILFPSTLDTA